MTLIDQIKRLRDRQIVHIMEHQDKFDAHQTMHRSVEEYFGEYWRASEPDELYRCLCNDLDLVPRKECLDL